MKNINKNYEVLFFLSFMVAMTLIYLLIGNAADGKITVFGVEIRSEYIFNTFLMFSITLIARKLLLAEQQWRATFQAAVEETNKTFLDEVKTSVPLSNMRFIDNEADWYGKAISMLQDPTGFTDAGNPPPRIIFASTTVLQVPDHEVLSTPRLNYFDAIAEKCCSSSEDAPQYRLLLSPGNDGDTASEIKARLSTFDSTILKAISDNAYCKSWGGSQIQVRVADISGIDFVIYGNSVLFNLRTYRDEHKPQRKGIYVNDANIATTFRRWFLSIYDDATNSKPINPAQARLWTISKDHSIGLGVESETIPYKSKTESNKDSSTELP